MFVNVNPLFYIVRAAHCAATNIKNCKNGVPSKDLYERRKDFNRLAAV